MWAMMEKFLQEPTVCRLRNLCGKTYLMTSHGNSAVSMAFCTHEETVKRRDRDGCRSRMALRHTRSIPSQGRVQVVSTVLTTNIASLSQPDRTSTTMSLQEASEARKARLVALRNKKDGRADADNGCAAHRSATSVC
jgi:hypothetical protein